MSGIPVQWRLKASKGKGTFLVDDADIEKVLTYKWCRHNAGYLISWLHGRMGLLHRWLMDAPKGAVVDHINGDKSDNRRSNLRVCTQRENSMNCRRNGTVEKMVGIWRAKHSWVAQCRGRHLGTFATPFEAAMRYDLELFAQIGHGARFNFPCAFIGER